MSFKSKLKFSLIYTVLGINTLFPNFKKEVLKIGLKSNYSLTTKIKEFQKPFDENNFSKLNVTNCIDYLKLNDIYHISEKDLVTIVQSINTNKDVFGTSKRKNPFNNDYFTKSKDDDRELITNIDEYVQTLTNKYFVIKKEDSKTNLTIADLIGSSNSKIVLRNIIKNNNLYGLVDYNKFHNKIECQLNTQKIVSTVISTLIKLKNPYYDTVNYSTHCNLIRNVKYNNTNNESKNTLFDKVTDFFKSEFKIKNENLEGTFSYKGKSSLELLYELDNDGKNKGKQSRLPDETTVLINTNNVVTAALKPKLSNKVERSEPKAEASSLFTILKNYNIDELQALYIINKHDDNIKSIKSSGKKTKNEVYFATTNDGRKRIIKFTFEKEEAYIENKILHEFGKHEVLSLWNAKSFTEDVIEVNNKDINSYLSIQEDISDRTSYAPDINLKSRTKVGLANYLNFWMDRLAELNAYGTPIYEKIGINQTIHEKFNDKRIDKSRNLNKKIHSEFFYNTEEFQQIIFEKYQQNKKTALHTDLLNNRLGSMVIDYGNAAIGNELSDVQSILGDPNIQIKSGFKIDDDDKLHFLKRYFMKYHSIMRPSESLEQIEMLSKYESKNRLNELIALTNAEQQTIIPYLYFKDKKSSVEAQQLGIFMYNLNLHAPTEKDQINIDLCKGIYSPNAFVKILETDNKKVYNIRLLNESA